MVRRRQQESEDLDGDEALGEEASEEIVDEVESGESESTEEAVADEETGSEESLEGEFGAAIGDDVLDEYDETDLDLKVVDEVLSHKDQNARALAIRRAIEERLESKRLSRDLDYLDLDD